MSVVKSKQGEGKLVVVTKARELAEYTLKICANEKTFPKRYRWCMTAKIVEAAMNINNGVNMANSVFVYDDADYMLRKQYQTRALAETYALWTRLIYDVQNLLRNWRKAERERYSNSNK